MSHVHNTHWVFVIAKIVFAINKYIINFEAYNQNKIKYHS
jgi:hypothetical protein